MEILQIPEDVSLFSLQPCPECCGLKYLRYDDSPDCAKERTNVLAICYLCNGHGEVFMEEDTPDEAG